MRIAHIGGKGLPSRGGTERVIEAVATRQARAHDVTVYGSARICPGGEYQGVHVKALRVPKGKYSGPLWLDVAATVHALVSRRYDVVHIHGAENTFTARLLGSGRLLCPPTTVRRNGATSGGIASVMIRSAVSGSVKNVDVPTAVALSQANALTEAYGVRVRHIPNGVDTDMAVDAVAALQVLAGLELDPGRYALFAAARVDPAKGCLDLIKAWRTMDCPTPLLVVGDLWHAPGYESDLKAAADGMAIHFLPRIEDKAVLAGLVASADVFVFPSTVEAMSMMLLEAMALGAPVLASDIIENMQVIPDGAWSFVAGDSDDLARAYREFKQESRVDVEARCEERVRLVSDRYSWDAIVVEYGSAYVDASQTRRSRRSRS